MKEFVLLSLKGKTSEFDINELYDEGRMDLVSRFVSSALFISDHLRPDTVVHICLNGPLNPPKMISFYGEFLINFKPDEKSIAKYILLSLKKSRHLNLNEEIESFPGIKVSKKSFENFVKSKSKDSQLIYLDKKGISIRNFEFDKNILFILGDNLGLPKKTEKLLDRLMAKKISLSPYTLFASHCVILVHNQLDITR